MNEIYTNGRYLESTTTWHAEDSAWKAGLITKLVKKNGLRPSFIAEVGCGAGGILSSLYDDEYLADTRFEGYDISPQAIKLAIAKKRLRLAFFNEDFLKFRNEGRPDVLMLIDVLEHVPDYMGLLEKCRTRATHKILHIPLDIHVSSVFRNSFLRNRYTLGHLHYFTAESALATLNDLGYEVIDFVYTNAAFELFAEHPSLKKAIANIPRWLISRFSVGLAARLFGGYSLLVLAK